MTNWEKYFGSPEKLVDSLLLCSGSIRLFCPMHVFEGRSCGDCELEGHGCTHASIEWLQEEAS